MGKSLRRIKDFQKATWPVRGSVKFDRFGPIPEATRQCCLRKRKEESLLSSTCDLIARPRAKPSACLVRPIPLSHCTDEETEPAEAQRSAPSPIARKKQS